MTRRDFKEAKLVGGRRFIRLMSWLARMLPRWLAIQIGEKGGALYALFSPRRRAIVERNLAPVLGTENRLRLCRMAMQVFGYANREYYDLAAPQLASREEAFSFVELEEPGWSEFLRLYRQGQGLLLVVAHLSSFDLAAQYLAAQGVPVSILVLPETGPMHDFLNELRRLGGVQVLPVGPKSVRRAWRALQQGQVVVVAGDRPVKGQGSEVDFFGRPTVLPDGHVRLALHTQAAVGTVFCRWEQGRFRVRFESLELLRSGDQERDIQANMQRLTRRLESYIRARPEQWHLFLQLWD
ncbi:MAG: hypothetical protein JXA37_08830 [Chloroflexia bacterium]|nr:hypothetical protein [Chloroflexia bacterium]